MPFTEEPNAPLSKKSRPNGCLIYLGILAVVAVIVTLIILFGPKKDDSLQTEITNTPDSSIPSTTNEPVKHYRILTKSSPGNFNNYDVLVDSINGQMPQLLVTANIFKIKECKDAICNNIGFWDNERAYDLYQTKRRDEEWLKRNWVFICEHFVGNYNATVGEFDVLPMIDSQYREMGGKQTRPVLHNFDL